MPRTEQAKHNKEHRDFQEFFGKWRAAKKEYVRSKMPPPQPPGKKPRKNAAGVPPVVGRKTLKWISKMEQRQAATMCPPGGHIWRGFSSRSWQCHLPPWSRKSYPVDVYDPDEAICFDLYMFL
jgi:hypothetical protein